MMIPVGNNESSLIQLLHMQESKVSQVFENGSAMLEKVFHFTTLHCGAHVSSSLGVRSSVKVRDFGCYCWSFSHQAANNVRAYAKEKTVIRKGND